MRVTRTYNIALVDHENPTDVLSYKVNLTYDLNEDNEAVDGMGKVIPRTGWPGQLEAMRRLRRLSDRKVVDVDGKQIEARDWEIRLVRERLVS